MKSSIASKSIRAICSTYNGHIFLKNTSNRTIRRSADNPDLFSTYYENVLEWGVFNSAAARAHLLNNVPTTQISIENPSENYFRIIGKTADGDFNFHMFIYTNPQYETEQNVRNSLRDQHVLHI